MSGKKVRSVDSFAETHGAAKLHRVERELAIERQKVKSIAARRKDVTLIANVNNTFKFGLIGDTHVGSTEHYADGLAAFYQLCTEAGVTDVLHCGDVFAGWRVYKGQEFELADVGWDEQKARLIKVAPQPKGMRTRFITGNHDASFTNLIGLNVGEAIHEAVPSWEFLGEDSATVRFVTEGGAYDVMLLHPAGGTAYALSYRPQKTVEQLEGGRKPNMVAIGHYHKAEFIPTYRNVAVVQCGCFEWQTPFMVRKSIAAHVGGWIIEVSVGESWNIVKPQFIAFYR